MNRNNQFFITGFLSGITGPAFILMLIFKVKFGGLTLSEFVSIAIEQKIASSLIALSLLLNLALFFLYLRFNRLQVGKGIILATLIWAFAIIYFKFFT